jgi:hypothetical protein
MERRMDNEKGGGGDAEKMGKEDTQGNIWSSEGGIGMENKNKWQNTTVISEAGHSCGNKKGKNEMGRACTKNARRKSDKIFTGQPGGSRRKGRPRL